MKLRIIAAAVLLAVLIGGLFGARHLQQQHAQAEARHEALSDQLKQLYFRADALEKELNALTTDAAQARQEEAQALETQALELKDQLAELETAIEEVKTYLEENQAAVEEATAELTYLQGVYDELKNGLTQVEGYLAGN